MLSCLATQHMTETATGVRAGLIEGVTVEGQMDTRGLASFFCESSLLRIHQRHHSPRTRPWYTPPAARRGERQHTRGRRAAACAAGAALGAALAGLSAARGAGGGAGWRAPPPVMSRGLGSVGGVAFLLLLNFYPFPDRKRNEWFTNRPNRVLVSKKNHAQGSAGPAADQTSWFSHLSNLGFGFCLFLSPQLFSFDSCLLSFTFNKTLRHVQDKFFHLFR